MRSNTQQKTDYRNLWEREIELNTQLNLFFA